MPNAKLLTYFLNTKNASWVVKWSEWCLRRFKNCQSDITEIYAPLSCILLGKLSRSVTFRRSISTFLLSIPCSSCFASKNLLNYFGRLRLPQKNLSFTISTKRFSNQLTHETSSFWGKSVQKIDNNCKIWKWKVRILILLLPRKMILSVPFIFSSLCNVAWHPHQKKTRQVSQAWLIAWRKLKSG